MTRSIHKTTFANTARPNVPGHMHRPRGYEPTLKQKAAEAQGRSLYYRKTPVTLPTAPWVKEGQA